MIRIKQFISFRNFRYLNEKFVIPALRKIEGENDSRKIKYCGEVITAIVCTNCHTKHFAGYSRCKNRWCLNCMHVKSMIWLARVKQRYDQVLERVARGEIRQVYPCHLILTVRDGPDVSERIEFIEKSWRLFSNGNKKWRKIFKKRFAGGVRSMEIKRGSGSGLWHVHYHIFLLCNMPEKSAKIKDFYWVRNAWKSITKGDGSAWIKPIYENQGSLIKGILETVKYVIKPSKELYTDDDFESVYWALKRKRTINCWGLFRGMSGEVEKDMDKIEQEKLAQFVCARCGCTEGELKAYLYDDCFSQPFYDIPKKDNQR